MAGYRSRAGQLSDNKPIKRTVQEKRLQLAELETHLQGMRPTVAPETREGVKRKIAQLKAEIQEHEVRASLASVRQSSPSAAAQHQARRAPAMTR